MKVCTCNLQKQAGLASQLIDKYNPDIMLCQEINLPSEGNAFDGPRSADNTSRMGYGTAIYSSTSPLMDVKLINSPYAEFGGFIRKKTIVATTVQGVQFVSFHGYNGQPFKSAAKLVAHVDAVLSVMTPGPAVFAGDFNTWSEEHLNAIKASLNGAGFDLAFSLPYPGRDFPLDHAFVRMVRLVKESSYFACASDHQGAILDIEITTT